CRFIDAMRARGCRIALDDFGSGLSSFAYLKRLPVDILKIDGAFIRDLARGEVDLALVRSMSQMGQALGKVTIAEWVESDAVLAQLREVGIGHVQGYAVHVPCPLDELMAAWESVPAGAYAEPA
ncbi:MAG TPA: EAL domain-containing protein, partial [Pseudoxanthomonas sp.]|nr:EAL domain-containing protein [Pseudoxanthomonas sp.]